MWVMSVVKRGINSCIVGLASSLSVGVSLHSLSMFVVFKATSIKVKKVIFVGT